MAACLAYFSYYSFFLIWRFGAKKHKRSKQTDLIAAPAAFFFSFGLLHFQSRAGPERGKKTGVSGKRAWPAFGSRCSRVTCLVVQVREFFFFFFFFTGAIKRSQRGYKAAEAGNPSSNLSFRHTPTPSCRAITLYRGNVCVCVRAHVQQTFFTFPRVR